MLNFQTQIGGWIKIALAQPPSTPPTPVAELEGYGMTGCDEISKIVLILTQGHLRMFYRTVWFIGLLVGLTVTLANRGVLAEELPQWRGPNRDRIFGATYLA